MCCSCYCSGLIFFVLFWLGVLCVCGLLFFPFAVFLEPWGIWHCTSSRKKYQSSYWLACNDWVFYGHNLSIPHSCNFIPHFLSCVWPFCVELGNWKHMGGYRQVCELQQASLKGLTCCFYSFTWSASAYSCRLILQQEIIATNRLLVEGTEHTYYWSERNSHYNWCFLVCTTPGSRRLSSQKNSQTITPRGCVYVMT